MNEVLERWFADNKEARIDENNKKALQTAKEKIKKSRTYNAPDSKVEVPGEFIDRKVSEKTAGGLGEQGAKMIENEINNRVSEVKEKTKEDLKKKIEKQSAMNKISSWAKDHKKGLIIGGSALAAAGLTVGGVKAYKHYKKKKAADELRKKVSGEKKDDSKKKKS